MSFDRVSFVIATIIYSSSPPLFLASRFWEPRDQPQPGFFLEARERTLGTRFSLRSWRYCVIKVLAAEPRSKKRSGDEARGSAAKSHSTGTQYRQLRRLNEIGKNTASFLFRE